jgi:hypothetical protein
LFLKEGGVLMVPPISYPLIRRQKKRLHLLLHPQKPNWLIVSTIGYEILQFCDGERKKEGLSDIQLYIKEISRKGWIFSPQKKPHYILSCP